MHLRVLSSKGEEGVVITEKNQSRSGARKRAESQSHLHFVPAGVQGLLPFPGLGGGTGTLAIQ